jgi:hypothetical protein
MQVNPVIVYSTFMAVKLHFQPGSYDAFKYHFKVPVKKGVFQSNERFFYEKIAKKYSKYDDLVCFFLANVLDGNKWIGDMSDSTYLEWQGKMQSMKYHFNCDMNFLRDFADNHSLSFDDCLRGTTDVPVLNLLMKQKIREESVIILDVLVGFLKHINKNLASDPLGILSDAVYRLQQYKPFLLPRINIAASKNHIINLFTSVDK